MRARIRANIDFKMGMKHLRRNAEQEFVRELTSVHYHKIDCLKDQIKQSKRPKGQNTAVNAIH